MNPPVSLFRGASGINYSYYIFDLSFRPKDSQFGNYMLARRSDGGGWIPVYIGQGDLKEHIGDKNHLNRARKKGATHILARTNPNEKLRHIEERDMLAAHPEVCAPTGCNEIKPVKPAPLRVPQKRN
ncbi:MAG: hypothetical protein ACRESA_06155 [Gammaproteobacteria bacterium]